MKQLLLITSILMSSLGAQAELVYALTTSNVLFAFDSATPGTQANIGTLTGLVAGQTPVGIDFRPATGELFLLSHNSATFTAQLYTVNLTNATLTAVGAGFALTNSSGVASYGFDFNPAVDRIRLTVGDGDNYRLNPNTGGLVLKDTSLTWDASAGLPPPLVVGGVADASNVKSATTTTLYGYDYNTDLIVRIGGVNGTPSPNGGVVFKVGGASGISATNFNFDLDISGATGVAYAMANNSLFTFSTNSGALSLLGVIAGRSVRDFSVAPPSRGELVYGLTTNGILFTFDSTLPGLQKTIGPLTGLTPGQSPVAIDFRPATGELFVLGYENVTYVAQLYTANLTNAVLTAVGAGVTLNNSSAAKSFGFDFNPVVDRLRVIRQDGLNLRLNPITGLLVATDTTVSWNGGAFPGTPSLGGLAYANNASNVTSTTLYGYDTTQNRLVTVGTINGAPTSPNSGVVFDIAATGVTAGTTDVGMDISGASGKAYAVVNNNFYQCNTNTGTFTLIGPVTGLPVADISVMPLRITRLAFVNGVTSNSDVVVTFTSSAGLRYNLQGATNFNNPAWADILTNISGRPGTTQVTNVNGASASQRLYQVVVVP